MVIWLNVCDKEHLMALRNNFSVTKKLLITKFDCITVYVHDKNTLVPEFIGSKGH